MACSCGRIFASHSSSHSNTPQSDGPACSSDVATPESRFAPVRLHTTRRPASSSASASRFVTVVFPFVPTTHTEPCSSFGARSAMRRGSTYSAILPGKFAAGRRNTFLRPHVETALTARAPANCKPIGHSFRSRCVQYSGSTAPRTPPPPAPTPALHTNFRMR